jgi:4-amino-4-deoxy-L-arabinose transferase-like glycosyltransferase
VGIAFAALFVFLLTRRVPRTWKFALLWIPVAILPVAFLTLRTSTRYLYLPSMGLAALIGLAWASAWAAAPLRRRALTVGLALVIVVQVAVMEVVLARRGELARREAQSKPGGFS